MVVGDRYYFLELWEIGFLQVELRLGLRLGSSDQVFLDKFLVGLVFSIVGSVPQEPCLNFSLDIVSRNIAILVRVA